MARLFLKKRGGIEAHALRKHAPPWHLGGGCGDIDTLPWCGYKTCYMDVNGCRLEL